MVPLPSCICASYSLASFTRSASALINWNWLHINEPLTGDYSMSITLYYYLSISCVPYAISHTLTTFYKDSMLQTELYIGYLVQYPLAKGLPWTNTLSNAKQYNPKIGSANFWPLYGQIWAEVDRMSRLWNRKMNDPLASWRDWLLRDHNAEHLQQHGQMACSKYEWSSRTDAYLVVYHHIPAIWALHYVHQQPHICMCRRQDNSDF